MAKQHQLKATTIVETLAGWNEDGEMQSFLDRAFAALVSSKDFRQQSKKGKQDDALMFTILSDTLRKVERRTATKQAAFYHGIARKTAANNNTDTLRKSNI